MEAALEEQAAELESALARQKTELEEKYGAEFDAAMEEGIREVTTEYKTQMQQIRERAWKLGWRAALRKVGVSEDDPAFRNPPKFPSSGSVVLSTVAPLSALGPSSEAPPAVASVDPPSASEMPPEVPEARLVISEATLASPEATRPNLKLF